MRILVSGAGIAGLTLAYWLHQSGHECTIVEKAPDIRTEGYMIDFGGTGWDVANMMGIVPTLKDREANVNLINFLHANGNIAASINTRELYAIAGVADKFIALNRRDIVAVLYEYVKSTTRICFGLTISDITESTDCVNVTFSDSTSASYDLVVAADGIHSHVRDMVWGDETQFTKFLGYHFAIFITPALDKNIPDGFDMYLEPGIQVSINPLPETDEWMIFITMEDERPDRPTSSEYHSILKHRLGQMGWLCPQIADVIHEDTYIFYDTITQIVNQQWSNGRVVLIGDAAHCPTLVSGQGASMAMAGAYFLSQELDRHNNLTDALCAYENRLRPHIEEIQTKAQNFAPNFVPSSRWKITLIQWVMKLSNVPIAKTLIGKQFSVKSIFDSEPA